MRHLFIAGLVLALVGCGSKEKDDEDGDTGTDTGSDVVDEDATTMDPPEDVPVEDVADEEAVELSVCEQLDLPLRTFDDTGSGYLLYNTAQDFTVQTLDGPWTLSENWSGCEVYLFIQDVPRQTEGWPVPLWNRDVDALFARAPRNVHFFFVSYEPSYDLVVAALEGLQMSVDAALEAYPAEDQAWWQERVHYVTDGASAMPSWLGVTMRNPGWGSAIDRFQRIRYIGSYADYSRYDAGRGWFAPNLSMAANEAVYYNFEAEREERLEAQGATVIEAYTGEVLEDPGWAGTRHPVDVTFPDASTMAGFDTMEFDLYLGCDGFGEYGTCPPWDYIASVYLCDETDPTSCDLEVGRWITTYHREGRWVHDVSGLLPLLAGGGERRFEFYTQQPYEVYLSIRLFDQGKTEVPTTSHYLFSGGRFDDVYNDAYSPVVISIPAEATKVEIATVISGHGQVDPGNCAEFCNTTHHFFVNGTENVISFPEAGTSEDCMSKAAQGTVPNQYGTWWYGRSGWCPGMEVPMVYTDVTEQVTPGSDATFDYEGFYSGAPYTGSGANIRMDSWLVISL